MEVFFKELHSFLLKFNYVASDILVITENMFSQNQATLKLMYQLIGAIRYQSHLYDFDYLEIKAEKGKSILKTMTGKSSVYTDQKKELSCNFFEEKQGFEVSDDIADSYILLEYFLQEIY